MCWYLNMRKVGSADCSREAEDGHGSNNMADNMKVAKKKMQNPRMPLRNFKFIIRCRVTYNEIVSNFSALTTLSDSVGLMSLSAFSKSVTVDHNHQFIDTLLPR